ncbi:uncharacterized protein [Pyrus communis]|uniref:uncharacterized protein n=1 Tax=Pyrus communis TaxID=23211 RepID=UPI0035C19DE5
MAIGDFNAILGAHEQMGGGRLSQTSCAEFSNMSYSCNFTHLNTSGAAFTWLELYKLFVVQWNFSVFGDVHNRVADPRYKLSMIQQRISTEGINNDLFEEEIVAKITVIESLKMQEAFWKDRTHVKWLTEEDINSSFFHAYACIKSSSSCISCILDGDNLLTHPQAIENHIVNFYQTLFGSSFTPSGIDEVCEIIRPMVTDSENDLLSALPIDEEIKETFFSLSASSTPRPDAFPSFFYYHCWDIVGFDVIQFVKQFCQSNCDGATLRNLQGFLDRYSRPSGQFINKAKSTFYLGSTSRHRKVVVESYLGFKEGKWPSSLLRSFSRCARNFIWSGDVTSKKIVTVSWRLCAPKNEGSLGLCDLYSLNTTALLKLGWNRCWVIGNGFSTSLWVDKWWFSPQLRNVWLASGFFLLMAIWKMHNKVKFESKPSSFSRLCRSTLAWIRQVGVLTLGHARGILDRQLLVSLGILAKACKALFIVPVLWHPPHFSWVKVNTDGLAKGNSGHAACGGVFRDSAGYFLGGFSVSLGYHTSFYAELHAVELAHAQGWQNLWLESDSSSVISCFASGSFSPPWSLQTR